MSVKVKNELVPKLDLDHRWIVVEKLHRKIGLGLPGASGMTHHLYIMTVRVTFPCGHMGASRKSPSGALWEALDQKLISADPEQRSEYTK